MRDPDGVTGIGFSASRRVHEAIESVGRTEDVRFSPNSRRLALAGFVRDRIAVFDVDIVRSASGTQVALTGGVELSSPALARPHGLDFIDDGTLVVANREGGVVIFTLPPGTEEIQTCQAVPLQTLPTGTSGIVRTPGSVAVINDEEHGTCKVLVCNNYAHNVTRHALDTSAACAVRGSELLLRKWLAIPDGVSVSADRRWLAVSNHDQHSVLLYQYGPSVDPEADPDGVLCGVRYPHGVRFTQDGERLLVADAGAPFVLVYARPAGGSWHGVHQPAARVRVMDESLFLRGRHNPQEGGPKGIDIDSGSRVLVVTSELLPLVFFDLAATFEQSCASTAPRSYGAGDEGAADAAGARVSSDPRERAGRQEAAVAVEHELFLFEERRQMNARITELKASLDHAAPGASLRLFETAPAARSLAPAEDRLPHPTLRQVRSETAGGADAGARVCGQCKACCSGWLTAEVQGDEMGKGIACRFLKPEGCGIHGNRPEVCRSFVCGWLKPGSPFPEQWRPDRIGFMIREALWEGRTCWLLLYAGQEPSEEVMEAMRRHSIATGEPHIIKKQHSWLCYGKPEFREAMARLAKEAPFAAERMGPTFAL